MSLQVLFQSCIFIACIVVQYGHIDLDNLNVQDAVVIGGLDMQKQARELARRPHVVIGTPGRLRVSLFPQSPMVSIPLRLLQYTHAIDFK